MTIRLQRSPSISSVRLIGQPERCAASIENYLPRTACKIGSVDLNRNCLLNETSCDEGRNDDGEPGAGDVHQPGRLYRGSERRVRAPALVRRRGGPLVEP